MKNTENQTYSLDSAKILEMREMKASINEIIDNYLRDHYGELDERAKKHLFTRGRVELLMMNAYHKGLSKGKGESL